MSAHLTRIVLSVDDLALAAEFYGLLLGVEGRVPAPRALDFECAGASLRCAEGSGGSGVGLHLAVTDLDGAFARARVAGCTSLDPQPRNLPEGGRGFACRDPWGNSLWLVGP